MLGVPPASRTRRSPSPILGMRVSISTSSRGGPASAAGPSRRWHGSWTKFRTTGKGAWPIGGLVQKRKPLNILNPKVVIVRIKSRKRDSW